MNSILKLSISSEKGCAAGGLAKRRRGNSNWKRGFQRDDRAEKNKNEQDFFRRITFFFVSMEKIFNPFSWAQLIAHPLKI